MEEILAIASSLTVEGIEYEIFIGENEINIEIK